MSNCNHKMTYETLFGDCDTHGEHEYEFRFNFCSICGMTESEIELKAENEELKLVVDEAFESGFKYARGYNLKLDEAFEEWKKGVRGE